MRTAADTPAAAAIERRSTAWLAWALFGAVLAMLALEVREAAWRNARSAPVIEVEASSRVIVGLPPEHIAPVAALVLPAVSAATTTPVAGAAPRTLIGVEAGALRAALGAPDFVRRDGLSQMWRYGNGACTLTVFLHGRDGGLAVEHVEGRGLRGLGHAGFDCGERLVGERRPGDLPG